MPDEVSELTRRHLAAVDRATPGLAGPAERGKAAAKLGSEPYTYDVVLILDGVRHVARASWPADQIVGNEPSVALRFEPPLPGLGEGTA